MYPFDCLGFYSTRLVYTGDTSAAAAAATIAIITGVVATFTGVVVVTVATAAAHSYTNSYTVIILSDRNVTHARTHARSYARQTTQ